MKLKHVFRAPDPESAGAGGGVSPAPAADAAPAPSGQPVSAAPDVPAAPSHRDWNGLAQNIRGISQGIQQLVEKLSQQGPSPDGKAPAAKAEPVATGDVAAVKAEFQRELEFRDALDAHGVDPKHRAQLKRLYAAERPQDLESWMSDTVEAFGMKPKQPAPVKPVVPPTAPSDTGPPVVASSGELDPNPNKWPSSVLEKMTPDEIKTAVDKWINRAGGRNPYGGVRRAHDRT